MIDSFKKIFPDNKDFIRVSEGKSGVETFFNPEIMGLNSGYKKLIKAFLEGVIKDLDK